MSEKSNKQIRALIEVALQPQKSKGFDQIAHRIAKNEQVTDVFLLSGEYDLLVAIEAASLEDVSHFVSESLAPIEHVRSTVTHFVLKKYKEAGQQVEDDRSLGRLSVSL